MKILVTGSNGCVGAALKELCNQDDQWLFLERKHLDLLSRQDTIDVFKYVKPDYVVHLAAYVPGFYSINRPASFSQNVLINENVLEACHLANVQRALFGLSINTFPEVPSKFPMTEAMIMDGKLEGPMSGYGYSKRMLALQCDNYNQQYGRQYFGIIPCNIFGPTDNVKSGRLIPSLIDKFKLAIENNTDVTINGTGKPLRQFIYAPDLAVIVKHLILNYSETKLIICSGETEVTIFDLVCRIAEIMNFKREIKFDISKPDGNLRKTVDNSYLNQIMPEVKFTSFELALRETIKLMGKDK